VQGSVNISPVAPDVDCVIAGNAYATGSITITAPNGNVTVQGTVQTSSGTSSFVNLNAGSGAITVQGNVYTPGADVFLLATKDIGVTGNVQTNGGSIQFHGNYTFLRQELCLFQIVVASITPPVNEAPRMVACEVRLRLFKKQTADLDSEEPDFKPVVWLFFDSLYFVLA
jgi:hypothetical protein